jgi:beta-lactam-binding protein with PASTA domain
VRRYLPRDWVFPIVFAAFVGVLVWFGHQLYGLLLPAANTITVPSFVGQTSTDAQAAAQQMHLVATVVDHGTSDRYPKGVVMNQRPEAGTTVRAGRQIDFVVSDGIITRLMPDLRYQSLREVQLDLIRAKLSLGKVTYVKSDVVPDGHVIDQDPAPLANVVEGQAIDVVVSKGGAQAVRVPSFTGMSIDRARSLARKMGIKLGQIVWTPLGQKGPPHGRVARQSVPPGTRVTEYQPVSLQVSAGPNESGYIIRQVRVLASVPAQSQGASGKSVVVVLRVHDATGSYDAYRAYAQPGQKLDFTVTAVGTSVVDLFVDNRLAGETRLGDEPAHVYGGSSHPSPSPSPGGR